MKNTDVFPFGVKFEVPAKFVAEAKTLSYVPLFKYNGKRVNTFIGI